MGTKWNLRWCEVQLSRTHYLMTRDNDFRRLIAIRRSGIEKIIALALHRAAYNEPVLPVGNVIEVEPPVGLKFTMNPLTSRIE